MAKKNKGSFNKEMALSVWGLSTSVKEYKLAWSISNQTDLELVKQKDYEIYFDEVQYFISNFIFETEHSIYRLLNNSLVGPENKKLMSSIGHFDFFITVQSEDSFFDLSKFTITLRDVNAAEYVENLDFTKLKNKENLVLI